MGLIDIAGADFRGGNDLATTLHPPMDPITQLGFTPAHTSCLGIGGAKVATVNFALLPIRLSLLCHFLQPGLQLLIAVVEVTLHRLSVDYGMIGSLSLHYTGIDKNLAAIDPLRLYTLLHHWLKEAFEYLCPPPLTCFGYYTRVGNL